MPRPRIDIAAARQKLVEAAEALLVRHGPRKVTVSDIAAQCGMSQSNAYRFFPSKASLMSAITARWFEDLEVALKSIVSEDKPPRHLIRNFLLCQLRLQRDRHDRDPELFQSYLDLGAQNMDPVWVHVKRITALLQVLVQRWLVSEGQTVISVESTTQTLEDATILFRDPNLIARRRNECDDDRAERTIETVLRGIEGSWVLP